MVGHLAGLADNRLILSFAPSTLYYEILKRIGEFFPKGSKVKAPSGECGNNIEHRTLNTARSYQWVV